MDARSDCTGTVLTQDQPVLIPTYLTQMDQEQTQVEAAARAMTWTCKHASEFVLAFTQDTEHKILVALLSPR